jgi:hypothetical protein
MNVAFSQIETAERVWFDASCGKLFIQAGDFVNGIDLSLVPDVDFESQSPIRSFTLGQSGAIVVCHHADGEETWFPVDMWSPDGFTPLRSSRKSPGLVPSKAR